MRVFLTRPFDRFIAHEGIDEAVLCEAILRAGKGLIDADLGGGVIKQRLARKGQGRSGGFRTIILFRQDVRSFFVYGFAKNEQENINRNELKAFRKLASEMLALDEDALISAMQKATIREIVCHA